MDTLRYGASGTQVQLLQLALQRAGYREIKALDGIFGNDTQRAVLHFQKNNGLSQDGIVGPRTWSLLMPWLLGYRRVTLRRGDTFYRLAGRYGSTLRAIEAANPQLDPLHLQIGQTVIVPIISYVVPTDIPMTFRLMELCLQGLQARYPFLSISAPGSSVMGKPLYFVRLGTGGSEVFFNAAHHANEWITSTLLMKYLENAAREFAFNGNLLGQPAVEVLARTSAWFAPMVNPDGAGFQSLLFDSFHKKYSFRAIDTIGCTETAGRIIQGLQSCREAAVNLDVAAVQIV